MYGNSKLIVSFVLMSILFLGIASAADPPGFPLHFYGDVTINGVSAPDGVLVEARVSGDYVAGTTTSGGTYGEESVFYVPDPHGTMHGKTIEFYVEDVKAAEYIFNIMDNPVNLDLSVSIENFCGDGICDSGESCSSCPGDCGSCDTGTDSGSDSGSSDNSGGSGGFMAPPSGGDDDSGEDDCTENWSCTGWSECISGKQTRTCADSNRCGTTEEKPEEVRDCNVVEVTDSCEEGETTCDGNTLMACSSDGKSWKIIEECEYRCTEGGCVSNNPFSFTGFMSAGNLPLIGGIVVLVIIATSLYLLVFRRR